MTDHTAATGSPESLPIRIGHRIWATFFDFSGRSSAWQFFVGVIKRAFVLSVVAIVITLGAAVLDVYGADRSLIAPLSRWLLNLLSILFVVRPVIRRFHDLNFSAWSAVVFAWAFVVANALMQRIPIATYSKHSDDGAGGGGYFSVSYPENLQDLPLLILSAIPMLFIFVLLLWGGTKGPNRFGPAPE